ncbi:MAG: hypothetical protein AUF65_01250 [Chloroflexi bacterium 13_1_20CM_50_12]|nr:MAG: hypothetical protein AUF65_01250 [Chloroflexi bacterium 13_1_20CM_50_12]
MSEKFDLKLTEFGKNFMRAQVGVPIHIEITQEKYRHLRHLLICGLLDPCIEHKQWYLEQITKVLGIDVEDLGHEEGIAP